MDSDPSSPSNTTVALTNALSAFTTTISTSYMASILAEAVLFGEPFNFDCSLLVLTLASAGVHSMIAIVSLTVLM